MKRPQGFDRPPQPPSAPPRAATSRTSAPSRPPKATPQSNTPPVHSAADDRAITEPIALVGKGASSASSSPSSAVHPESRVGTGSASADAAEPPVGREKADVDRAPSNREIRRALRRARKERARVERGEVRRFTKRSRRRRMAWLGAAGTAAFLVIAVTLTAFSPLMALRTIEVVGTSRVKAADVTAALKDQLGRPLPLVDFNAIRADLAAFPLIRSFSTESHPPSTLIVRIVERVPIGVITDGKTFRLVDAAKVTISQSASRPAGFPVIHASGPAGTTDAQSGFDAAVAVLQALPAHLLGSVDTITAATRDDVTFTLLGSGARVIWGSPDQSDLKAADLAAIMKSAGASSGSVFDVSSPHSVVRK
ncbi:MAG TPA: FtsQ-type POTRA domain-containing protein [Diaminobutyricibacter sp.]